MSDPQHPYQQPASAHPTAAPGHPASAAPHQPAQRPKRLILGLHPALFTGIVLLVAVAILAIVLVFTGSIAQHGARVFWTLVTFVAFTGLLSLDLSLSRRNSRPLVIGTVANSYMIIAIMLAIWIWARGQADGQIGWGWTENDAALRLIYEVPMIILVTRGAWALAWAVLTMGERIRIALGSVFGIVTAGLIGISAVMLTLHVPLYRFGIDVDDWYWRTLVAALILTALAACILLLLYWNQRSGERAAAPVMSADGRGVPHPYVAQQSAQHQPGGWPQQPGQQQPGGVPPQAQPQAGPGATPWPQAPHAGLPPVPPQPPYGQPAPHPQPPQTPGSPQGPLPPGPPRSMPPQPPNGQ